MKHGQLVFFCSVLLESLLVPSDPVSLFPFSFYVVYLHQLVF